MLFTEKVLQVVSTIKKGETLSYKQVAERAGSPKAFRSVGSILKKNQNTNIPCHRVIKSNGDPGEYNNLLRKNKSEILREEKCQ